MKDYLTKIKVDKKIKPIHFKDRKDFDLLIGANYFVSFGLNVVTQCKLVDIDEYGISIEIPVKSRSKKGFIDLNGNISHDWKTRHKLYRNEIGRTPEEAVVNEVSM